MPRFSTSFSDDQHEWIQSEADRQSRSKADIVRQCIDLVRTGEHRTGADRTDVNRTEPVHTDVVSRDEFDTLEQRVGNLEQLVGDELPDDVVTYVCENQPASRKEICAAFADEIDELGIKGDSWWRRHARPALEDGGAEFTRNVGWEIEK